MAIAMKGGELYFITELDLLTGKPSGYYKIGLAKDTRRGASPARLDEHQTGNPRQLEFADDRVWAPAIEALEAAMHARFATDRVRGEWFKFSPMQLTSAVAAAKGLAAQLEDVLPALRTAKAAEDKQPKSTTGRPDDDDVEWHRQAVEAKRLNARVDKLKKGVDTVIRAAAATDMDLISGIGTFNKQGAPSVSKTKVAALRPDLVAEYTTTSESEKRAFKLLGTTSKSIEVTVPKSFLAVESELNGLLDQQRRGRKYLEQLHLAFLELLKFSAEADWAYEFAVAEIMASCGRRPGIEDVCEWPWKVSPSTSFDAAAFKEAHPELAEQCMTQPARGFKVLPMRGYSPKR